MRNGKKKITLWKAIRKSRKITGMVVSKSRVSQIQRDILRICGAMSRLQCLISKLHQLMMLMIM